MKSGERVRFFHGTAAAFESSISKRGLVVPEDSNGPYVTPSLDMAARYAERKMAQLVLESRSKSRQGLVVTVEVPEDRVRIDPVPVGDQHLVLEGAAATEIVEIQRVGYPHLTFAEIHKLGRLGQRDQERERAAFAENGRVDKQSPERGRDFEIVKNGDGAWVRKSGRPLEQLEEELRANRAYRALGIDAPESHIEDGALYNRLVFGEPLSDIADRGRAFERLTQGFAADALLANWDVMGLGFDNIIVRDGAPWRIDNGGALRFRARGEPKGDAFGPHPSELSTLRDPNINPTAAEAFASLTESEIHRQIGALLERHDALMAALDDVELEQIVGARLEAMGALTALELSKS